MIDIENQVLNTVESALRDVYGDGISFYGEYVESPARFPSVCLEEDDNSDANESVTLARLPVTACNLMYTANVYSNLKTGKKSQAKAIMDIVDEQMHRMGFTRTSRNPLPNVDRTIYRLTARYTKVHQIFTQEE